MLKTFQSNGTIDEANEKIAQLMAQDGGLEKVAAMVLPELIREQRDYQGFARKVLVVDPVSKDKIQKTEKGEFFRQYPKDIGSAGGFFGEEFETSDFKITGDVVNVPILTIASEEARIDRKRLLVERIDYLNIARDKAAQAIAQLEDYRVMMLVENVIMGTGTKESPQYNTQVVTSSDSDLAMKHLVTLKGTQSQHDLETAAFVMNMATQDHILAWNDTNLDQETRRELVNTGVFHTLWGKTALITSRLIPLKTVYSFSEPGYVGVMPELQGLTPELVDTGNRLIKGVFVYEFVGFAIFSHKGIGKLLIGYSTGDKMVDYSDKIRVDKVV